ncbi:MAG: helix-turn-helix domain-containing protein [Cetobacterium sp.]|uniref:helix-turn-helix domain-containing protein n=1 Tax=Cetobacterium sp. TaxID=2071632 RepID=UPI003EE45CD5
MDKNKEIGNLFKEVRKKENYSLEDVQYLLKNDCNIDLDISNISRYEKGTVKNMNPKYIRAFCKVYKLDFVKVFKELDFLDENDFKNNEQTQSLTKREKGHYNNFMDQATMYFTDSKISEEDKKKVLDALTEVYFEAKQMNKRKK